MAQTKNIELKKELTRGIILINILSIVLGIITILLMVIAYLGDYYFFFMLLALLLSVTTSLISFWTLNRSVIYLRNTIENESHIISLEDEQEGKLRSSLVRAQVAKSFASSFIIFVLLVSHTYGAISFAPFFVLALVYYRQWNKIEDIRLDNYMAYLKAANSGQ